MAYRPHIPDLNPRVQTNLDPKVYRGFWRRGLPTPGDGERQGGGPGSPLRQLLRIVLPILLALLLVLLAAVGFDRYSVQKQGDAPATVVRQFCDHVVHQQYLLAYADLSVEYQDALTADDFVQNSKARDAADGFVLECRVLGRDAWRSFGPDHAAYTVTDVLTIDGRHTGTIYLSDYPPSGYTDGTGWAVDTIDVQLYLDGPTPCSVLHSIAVRGGDPCHGPAAASRRPLIRPAGAGVVRRLPT